MSARLLMTADTVGGVWTYSLELARALEPHGVSILLATMGAALTPDQREQISKLPNVEVAESGFKLEWMQDPWADCDRASEWLLGLAEDHHPDLVHLNNFVHGTLAWNAPVLMVGHSCVLSWWQAVKHEKAPAEWNEYRKRVHAGLQKADLVVAPSRAMLAELDRFYGPLASTKVIPNAVAAELFRPLVKEPFIFAAGRIWDEAKNLAALDTVAPRLSWPVRIAGMRQHPEGTLAAVANSQMLGRLSASELALLYGRASIYALPARYEPFGLSVLEAALSGCALVLGDIPSLRENWQGCAVFVPPEDEAALNRALTTLIENPTQRERLANRAFTRAQQFVPETMANSYLAAYAAVGAKEACPCA